jgi:hypothetical protein
MKMFNKIREFFQLLAKIRNAFLFKLVFPIVFKNNGIYVMNEEWNNLVILDGCRYDIFEKIFKKRKIGGKLEYRISRGTETVSFLLENFGKRKFNNVVYITANPFVNKLLKEDQFYKIISVWKDGWSEKYGTVLPSTMIKFVLKAIKKYPGKRFIIHFIQPHYPYINLKIKNDPFKKLRNATLKGEEIEAEKPIYSLFAIYSMNLYAKINRKLHFYAYSKNLEFVMAYIEKLLKILPGKTVVTSDHGECFGEILHPLLPIRIYGHPKGVRIKTLIKIPWLIVENKTRLIR